MGNTRYTFRDVLKHIIGYAQSEAALYRLTYLPYLKGLEIYAKAYALSYREKTDLAFTLCRTGKQWRD